MKFSDLFNFETLISPKIIKLVYWIGIVAIVISGLAAFFSAFGQFGGGAGYVVLVILYTLASLVFWRILCELYIVIFGIFDRLGQIRDELGRRPTL